MNFPGSSGSGVRPWTRPRRGDEALSRAVAARIRNARSRLKVNVTMCPPPRPIYATTPPSAWGIVTSDIITRSSVSQTTSQAPTVVETQMMAMAPPETVDVKPFAVVEPSHATMTEPPRTVADDPQTPSPPSLTPKGFYQFVVPPRAPPSQRPTKSLPINIHRDLADVPLICPTRPFTPATRTFRGPIVYRVGKLFKVEQNISLPKIDTKKLSVLELFQLFSAKNKEAATKKAGSGSSATSGGIRKREGVTKFSVGSY